MTEQTVNIPLLRKAVEWAEAEAAKPRELCEWEQRMWLVPPTANPLTYTGSLRADRAPECGTTYCIAGYVGQTLDARYAERSIVEDVPVSDFAQQALGLTEEQADDLFHASNTIEDVRRIAEEIAGERL